MINKKVLMTTILIFVTIMLLSTTAFAATFNLDIKFDGKTISMESEQTEMGLNITNLLPGETDISYLTVKNKGVGEVKLYFSASIKNDESDLLEILQIKIKDDQGKEIFTGDYDNFKRVELTLQSDEQRTYTILTTVPVETGNEYQGKEANIKFEFEAEANEITTTEIVKPKTGQTRVIYIILGICVVALIAVIIIKKNNKK